MTFERAHHGAHDNHSGGNRHAPCASGHDGGVTTGGPPDDRVDETSDHAADAVAWALAFRLERLQDAARRLIVATSAADVIEAVMGIVDTPVPAVSRGLWLAASEQSVLELVDHHHFAPSTAELFARIPTTGDLPGATACRERRTVVSVSRRRAEEEYPDLRQVERSAECFVAIPLLLEDTCLGVLGLGYDEEPAADDLAFLEAIAGQAAQALERVRLAERDRRRRDELEFLADLTDSALNATDHVDLIRRVTYAAVPALGDWCALTFLPTDGGPPLVMAAHVDPTKVDWALELQTRYPYDPEAEMGVAAVIRSGETEFIPDVTEQLLEEAVARSPMGPDEARAVVEALDLSSAITVPLRTKRRIVGAMQFVSAESGRHYDEADVDLAEAVAGRLAEPLDNAWIADQERHLSATLQRTLLPPRLPEIPGVEIAAGYWPAGSAEVGGDFYDVFRIDEDTWALIIGDACGTGPNSAALTSIARHTVRAAARHGRRHEEVLDWTNEAILKSDRDLFLTACYATLTRADGTWHLRFANAGHPLPVRLAERATAIGRPGTLLGVFPDVSYKATEMTLDEGDIIVFYTDGVTDLPPPLGLTADQLNARIEALPDHSTAGAVAEGIRTMIKRRVPEVERDDDVALLVIRIAGE
jgi:serine phosphatase RsbU (regulator of sigma subunit)